MDHINHDDEIEIHDASGIIQTSMAEIIDTLFNYAMRCDWGNIVELYKAKPITHLAEITRSKDTVLHLATIEGAEDAVFELINALNDDEATKVLDARNDSGNTPLHMAAGAGNAVICKLLASRCPSLIMSSRNENNMTPLFVAVEYNRMKVFRLMHYLMESKLKLSNSEVITCCRGEGGNTILHRAIFGEHFELAYEILHIYPFLAYQNNAYGESALHVLANKPSSFKSGRTINFIDSLIYAGIATQPLMVKNPTMQDVQFGEFNSKLPKNYTSCLTLYSLIAKCFIFGRWADETIPININREQNEPHYCKKKSFLPPIYTTGIQFFTFLIKICLVILGYGITRIEKLQKKKQKHRNAKQVMDELIRTMPFYKNIFEDGRDPIHTKMIYEEQETDNSWKKNAPQVDKGDASEGKNESGTGKTTEPEKKSNTGKETREDKNKPKTGTPILSAARTGIIEMVEAILDKFPIAAQDRDDERKNMVHLAVEHRQTKIYRYMTERNNLKRSIFARKDKYGNSALHLAAKLPKSLPWAVSGAALEINWEIKWYKFIKNSMPPDFFAQHNNNGETAKDIFTETHKKLVIDGGEWMNKTSQACSVVAALVATVAFTSATTIPGGPNSMTGYPILEGQRAFTIFAISSMIALCFSVISLAVFLSILTSRYQEDDFGKSLPWRLIVGLASLFLSIVGMLVSFCGGQFFVMKLNNNAYPLYVAALLPATLFGLAQFTLFHDLVKAIVTKVPVRTDKHNFAKE